MKKHFDTVMTFTGESAKSFSQILQWAHRTSESKAKLSQMLRDGDIIRKNMTINK